jgi:hypothetical protein
MNIKTFPCRDCGADVAWMTSKAGKRYLAQPWVWVGGDYSLHEKVIPAGHRCVPDPEWRARKAAADLSRIATAQRDGTIIKGVTVDVIKGRKVPVGTRAEVTWIGDGGYGPRVGLLIDGEKVYTALGNVAVAPLEDFPHLIEALEVDRAAFIEREIKMGGWA